MFLLDPTPLEPAVWGKLAEYVRGGGNAAIFLGPNARPAASFNEPAAQELLPAKLVRKWAAGARKLYLAPGAMEHQMLRAFRPIATTVPWNEFPIERHWVLGKLTEGASVVIAYSNNKPALVERPLGRGRVLVMTTPVSDPLRPPGGRKPWNYLPTGFEPWPFVMLANEMALYMTESGGAKWNYLAGQHAVLRESSDGGSGGYYLFMPGGGKPQRVTPRRGAVTVAFTQTPGTYRLKSIRGTGRRGFSVNVPASASRLDRITPEKLDRILGPGRYKLARNREEIVRSQGESRVGREFFPLLVLMVAVVLGLEHLLANRFYREKPVDVEQVSGE